MSATGQKLSSYNLPFLPEAAGLLQKNQVNVTKGKIISEIPNISRFLLEKLPELSFTGL